MAGDSRDQTSSAKVGRAPAAEPRRAPHSIIEPRPNAAPRPKSAGRTLVLFDGSLASLVGVAAAAEQAELDAQRDGGTGAAVRAPVLMQAPVLASSLELGLQPGSADEQEFLAGVASSLTKASDLYRTEVVRRPARSLASADDERVAGHAEALMLIEAGYAALAEGCGRVLWPVFLGDAAPARVGEEDRGPGSPEAAPPLEAVAARVDRALLASRMVSLDAGGRGRPREVTIDTPYVDLSDRQLVELALDIAAPVEACWWWDDASPSAERERARWTEAFNAL